MIEGVDLRNARVRAGLTQEQLAKRLGVTLRSVGSWERSSVPANKEALVMDLLQIGEAGNDLSQYSDMALLAEIGQRMARLRAETGGTGMATQLRRGVGVAEVTSAFKDRDETATEPAGVSDSHSDDQADTLGRNLGGGAVILGRVPAEDPNIGVQGSEDDTHDRGV